MSLRPRLLAVAAAALFCTLNAQAGSAPVVLIAKATLSGAALDKSGLTGAVENGVSASSAGGLGSGLAWAGGNSFIGLQDRGPNAVAWNAAVDNTTSFIGRFQALTLQLTASATGAALPFTLTPTLTSTTLLSSATALTYAAGNAPVRNTANQFYFNGRSDNFGAGLSTNPNNARLDPEALRVSADGKSVFISDEYGPYVYQFDRATGTRIKTFSLPDTFAVSKLSANSATEIASNSIGRIANKGMEGLAITPDGKALIGFMQSALAQDGGDGGAANRIIKIDIATGVTSQYAYDNRITLGSSTKAYNSSELVALNSHEFLVLERDGKGLGDGSVAVVKHLYKVDIAGAADVSGLSGQAALLAKAPAKTLFLDIKAALNSAGITDAMIPAKLEGMAFGADVTVAGVLKHTLYLANDNDFLGTVAVSGGGSVAYDNQFYVFAFDSDALGSTAFVAQEVASFAPPQVAAIPEPQTYALLLAGLGAIGLATRRKPR